VVALLVIGALLAGVYAIAAWLHRKHLDPEDDTVDRKETLERREASVPRPAHRRVENEQRTRLTGTR
jgi:hypothetical protein